MRNDGEAPVFHEDLPDAIRDYGAARPPRAEEIYRKIRADGFDHRIAIGTLGPIVDGMQG